MKRQLHVVRFFNDAGLHCSNCENTILSSQSDHRQRVLLFDYFDYDKRIKYAL